MNAMTAKTSNRKAMIVDDPYADPQFRQWAKRVKQKLIPMIENSAVVAAVCDPNNIDAKFAVELGVSVMLDKPIIAVIKPGTKIPKKLALVVDRFVEWNEASPDQTSNAIRDAMQSLGVIP